MLTVVVDKTDNGGADQAGHQVRKGQAEDGGLEQVLFDPEAHIDYGGVGEDGEQPADGHHDKQEVEQGRPAGPVVGVVGVQVPLVAGQACGHCGGRAGHCQVSVIAPGRGGGGREGRG